MRSRMFSKMLLVAFVLTPLTAYSAGVEPVNNPSNASGAKEFDWQKEWGSIHMNSFFDGINDPGTYASSNGAVGCKQGTLCTQNDVKTNVPDLSIPSGAQISNGIKFDIKNSLLNCMSKPVTNWAVNNPWNSDTTVCISSHNLAPPTVPHDSRSILYLPLWDKRANDSREYQTTGNIVGCQQQIINNCAAKDKKDVIIRDVHACINSTILEAEPAYTNPVTHVFSPQERDDLGGVGRQMPTTYWSYEKKLSGTDTRIALSAVDPEDTTKVTDRVPNSPVKKIVVGSNPDLARLKTYKFKDTDTTMDEQEFIIVDPSDFFDLRNYIAGGKYDSGYDKFYTAKGQQLVQTYDSCPVLGFKSTYAGICDPTGVAGCNLPIYGVGASTTFTDVSGNDYVYNDYPIKWSGYVKKWSIISVKQYLQNVRGREDLYLLPEDGINENPIIMLERADDYCEPLERTSRLPTCEDNTMPPPDMACIQYMQYTPVDENKIDWVFLDLYNPVANAFEKRCTPEYNVLELYDKDENGNPIAGQYASGSGTDRYVKIAETPTSTGYSSFLDDGVSPWVKPDGTLATRPAASYKQKVVSSTGSVTWETVTALKLDNPAVLSTKGKAVPGVYVGEGSDKDKKGTGAPVKPGQAVILRPTDDIKLTERDTSCVLVTRRPSADKNLFIPTNSQAEMQAFATAMEADPVEHTTLRPCATEFKINREVTGAEAAGLVPPKAFTKNVEVKTWVGKLNCEQLGASKPSCNETRRISAQRFCRLENGSFANCGECAKAKDADKDFNKSWFDIHVDASHVSVADKNVNGAVMASPEMDHDNQCFFAASCFNFTAEGCPGAGTSGGHVFCVSPDTKIVMADGKERAIVNIKPGEEVATFNAKATRSPAIGKGIVKAVAVTKKQKVIKINDLRITPQHKMVLASGRTVPAKEIKVGDYILQADGKVEEVKTIDTKQPKITVYNLVLENGSDGYIAGGKRVMSYPMLKEIDAADKAANMEKARANGRDMASIKEAANARRALKYK